MIDSTAPSSSIDVRRRLALALGVFRVILIEVALVRANLARILVAPAPWPVPEMKRLAVDAIRCGNDLEEVTACDLDGGYLRRGQSDEVGQQASDNGCVAYDQEVLFLPLQFD
jgi:hypothetical protein